MRQSAKLTLLITAAGYLLWPVWAPGESRVASEQVHPTSQPEAATAHVLFKIVIPQVLAMDIAAGERAGEQGLTISGNDHKASQITVMSSDAGQPRILLSVAGHRSIVQFARCVASNASAAPAMSCTVSMP